MMPDDSSSLLYGAVGGVNKSPKRFTSCLATSVSVPVAAVQHIDNQPVVFVQQSASRFERRNVQLGITVRDQLEIVSGLKPGETIVGAGSFYLKTALLRELIGDEH